MVTPISVLRRGSHTHPLLALRPTTIDYEQLGGVNGGNDADGGLTAETGKYCWNLKTCTKVLLTNSKKR